MKISSCDTATLDVYCGDLCQKTRIHDIWTRYRKMENVIHFSEKNTTGRTYSSIGELFKCTLYVGFYFLTNKKKRKKTVAVAELYVPNINKFVQ